MKKILSCFLAILTIFTLCISVFASDGELASSSKDMSSTSIQYDFEHVFLKKFHVGEFYENKLKAQPELITIAETGYKQGDKTEYKLFFYIYNPTRLEIKKDSSLDNIQLSTNLIVKDGSYIYTKQNIKLIDTYANSINSETHTNALILKYEIEDYSAFSASWAEETERHYFISSMELHLGNDVNASDFTIGFEYYYSTNNGWTSYYSKELDTLRFNDLEFSYYRVPTEDPDVFKDIQSVIVPIPNSYLNKYDTISKVSAVWEECLMKPALIVNDIDVYDAFKEVENKTELGEFEYSFGYGSDESHVNHKSYYFYMKFYARFYQTLGYVFNNNISLSGNLMSGLNYVVDEELFYCNVIDKLLYAFYSKDIYKSDKVCVSSEELIAMLDEYGWSDDVFESIDKTHYDLNNPEVLDITHIESLDVYRVPEWYEIFKRMVKLDGQEKTFSDIKAIDSNHYNMNNERFAEEYLVSSNDVNDIKLLHTKYPDCTLYVFRYTITDYITNRAYVYNSESEEPLCDAIIAQGTAIRNFDFIDLTFGSGDSAIVVPVSMDPQNYIPDYTGNSSYSTPPNPWNEFIEFLKTVLSVVLVIMIISIVIKVISLFTVKKTKDKKGR